MPCTKQMARRATSLNSVPNDKTVDLFVPGFRKNDVSKKQVNEEHRDRLLAQPQYTRANTGINEGKTDHTLTRSSGDEQILHSSQET
jgi:hypothetical protein